MSYPSIINAHLKDYPYRCKDLEVILDTTDDIRELAHTFETLVNIIFGYESSLNLSKNDRYTFQWHLKHINSNDTRIDFDCVYNFLNINSIFWSTAFNLTNIKANFKFPLHYFPHKIQTQIENGLSFLSRRLDTIKYINLNAIEYYLLCFVLNLSVDFNDRDPFQRRNQLYNQTNGIMMLNNVYGKLMDNYLDYFLPLESSCVTFPSLLSSTFSSPIAQTTATHRRPPRLLKNTSLMNTSQTDLTINASQAAESRKQDLQKIDFFLNLIIDLWMCPSNVTLANNFSTSNLLTNTDVIFGVSKVIEHVFAFSNVNYKAESTIRSFTNHTFDANNNTNNNLNQSFIDELRISIVDKYFPRAIYDYLKFNIENWPLNSSINLLIEVWLRYIQPWRPREALDKSIYDVFIQDIHPTQSIWSDFVEENLFLYTDVFEQVVKRFCIIDLTILGNVQLVIRMCKTLSQTYIYQKLNDIDTELSGLKVFGSRQLQSLSLLHHEESKKKLINVFKTFDKQISTHVGMKHLSKFMLKLVDNLNDIKNLLLIEQREQNLAKEKSFFIRFVLSLFTNDERASQFSRLNRNDCERLIGLINECITSLQVLMNHLPSDKSNDWLLANRIQRQNKDITNSDGTDDEMEPNVDGFTMRLSPRGRYKMINHLCRSQLEKVYDPETAPVSEFENRFLVNLMNALSSAINDRFFSQLQNYYNRNDFLGHMSHQFLYGPLDLKNKFLYRQHQPEDYSQRQSLINAKLSLRRMADYRYLVYSLLFYVLIKYLIFFGHKSNTIVILLMFGIYFCYFLVKSLVTYKRD